MHRIESSLLELYQNSNLSKLDSHTLFIAYSGGLDSTALLYAGKQLVKNRQISNIKALHVNHGIESNSDDWQSHCKTICEKLSVELISTQLKLASENRKPNENDARNKRYDFFKSQLKENDQIAFAHHQDDQVETLLFRLFRGTGLLGASSIPKSRSLGKGILIRPLLHFTKSELFEYAQLNKLDWIEDQSNQENKYSRNIIRNKIIPLIKTYWPEVNSALEKFIQIVGEQNSILQEVAESDLDDLSSDESKNIISVSKFESLSMARKKNFLHYWASQSYAAIYSRPTSKEIREFIYQLANVGQNTNHLNTAKLDVKLGGHRVRYFDGKLWLCESAEPIQLQSTIEWNLTEKTLKVDEKYSLILNELKSSLASSAFVVRAPNENEVVTVQARKGGERICPSYRDKSCELKKIFQELKVPHWKRKWLPIIYYNEELVCIPQILINKKFIPANNEPMILFSIKYI
ncbi:MAG: tRNA lysidine(34) synthetase TilS [Kangiellaceae bacterium]